MGARPVDSDLHGVSFAHGSNDGQKGMGLIMLILIGTVPTAYALNRALPASHVAAFASPRSGVKSRGVQGRRLQRAWRSPSGGDQLYRQHNFNEGTYPSLAALIRDISKQMTTYGSVTKIPFAAVGNTRNDMYLASEAIRSCQGQGKQPHRGR